MKTLASCLDKAVHRRRKLFSITNAVRLVNGAGDGLPGLLIDRYNKHFHMQVLDDRWQKQTPEILRRLTEALPVEYLVVKIRRGLRFETAQIIPGPSRTLVEEYGLKFEVDLNDGLNCGLFLDMRRNRHMVAKAAAGQRVLNCFSYTCSFGVHALAGAAVEVVNTDISRRCLERGKNNYSINGLPVPDEGFVKTDAVLFLQRACKKGRRFDIIILDPPSFARCEGGVFQVKRDLPKTIALAADVLGPAGRLLVTTNYSGLDHEDLERMLAQGLHGRRVAHLQRVGQDEDFVGTNSFKESYMVGLWVRFL
ncbi:MAG: class I SAM-dependent rRNA methyltransferase [Candidatus Omnitrophica bacterium]|nr:class I SAM-dependent rRNA methyltransferase [Candidatus Omnitrophota bacterium]